LVALSLNENGGSVDYNVKEEDRPRDPRRRFDGEGFREFVRGRLFGRLRVLSIQAGEQDGRRGVSWLGDAAMKELADSPRAANLLALDLGNQRVGDAGLRALAESPHLRRLRSLNLWRNEITDAGANLLADPDCLPALRSLDLR